MKSVPCSVWPSRCGPKYHPTGPASVLEVPSISCKRCSSGTLLTNFPTSFTTGKIFPMLYSTDWMILSLTELGWRRLSILASGIVVARPNWYPFLTTCSISLNMTALRPLLGVKYLNISHGLRLESVGPFSQATFGYHLNVSFRHYTEIGQYMIFLACYL